MSDSPDTHDVAPDDSTTDCAWLMCVRSPGQAVRFRGPADTGPAGCDVWVDVRPLSHREALERDSIGLVEEYALDEAGEVIDVVRRYDLWAMAGYDYAHSLTDFSLPERKADGSICPRRMADHTIAENLEALAGMGPELAAWVQRCIDKVNLRDSAGLRGLAEAKKN